MTRTFNHPGPATTWSTVETLLLQAYPMDYLGLAMHRAAEALQLGDLPLATPILDLGCHDGTFAGLALSGRVRPEHLVGCDRDLGALSRPHATGTYCRIVGAAAARLPFRDGTFGTVLCNSVLTHLENLDSSLAEIRRILRPSGRLLASVPTPHFHALLAPCQLARAAGFTITADRLGRAYDRAWGQRHFLDRRGWALRLQTAGLRLEAWTEYLGPRASMLWSGLFLATRLGVRRLTLGAILRRIIPTGTRRAAVLERALAPRLAKYLGGTGPGGSAFLVASVEHGDGSRCRLAVGCEVPKATRTNVRAPRQCA